MILITRYELDEFKNLNPQEWDTQNLTLKKQRYKKPGVYNYPRYWLEHPRYTRPIIEAYQDINIDQLLFSLESLAQQFACVARASLPSNYLIRLQKASRAQKLYMRVRDILVVRTLSLDSTVDSIAGVIALEMGNPGTNGSMFRHARYQTLKLALYLESLIYTELEKPHEK